MDFRSLKIYILVLSQSNYINSCVFNRHHWIELWYRCLFVVFVIKLMLCIHQIHSRLVYMNENDDLCQCFEYSVSQKKTFISYQKLDQPNHSWRNSIISNAFPLSLFFISLLFFFYHRNNRLMTWFLSSLFHSKVYSISLFHIIFFSLLICRSDTVRIQL